MCLAGDHCCTEMDVRLFLTSLLLVTSLVTVWSVLNVSIEFVSKDISGMSEPSRGGIITLNCSEARSGRLRPPCRTQGPSTAPARPRRSQTRISDLSLLAGSLPRWSLRIAPKTIPWTTASACMGSSAVVVASAARQIRAALTRAATAIAIAQIAAASATKIVKFSI